MKNTSTSDNRNPIGTPSPPAPPFTRQPGESPRAFGAFLAYHQLGQDRSLAAVSRAIGEPAGTIRNWSCRFRWTDRIRACQNGQLAMQIENERREAADWARRATEFRERKWATAQQLLQAVGCFLENFGDRELEKMSLSQVSRALQIATRVSNESLRGDLAPEEPVASPLQAELAAALLRAYGQAQTPPPQPSPPSPETPPTTPATPSA
jgi:hypothetical protein